MSWGPESQRSETANRNRFYEALLHYTPTCDLSVEEIKDNPETAASNLADELNAVVLLKGSTTYVSEPEGASIGSDASMFKDEYPEPKSSISTLKPTFLKLDTKFI